MAIADHPKDPRLQEAGRKGMRTRWGPPRVVRLDDLTAEQRDIVLALIAAAKAAREAEAKSEAPAVEKPGASMTAKGTSDVSPSQ